MESAAISLINLCIQNKWHTSNASPRQQFLNVMPLWTNVPYHAINKINFHLFHLHFNVSLLRLFPSHCFFQSFHLLLFKKWPKWNSFWHWTFTEILWDKYDSVNTGTWLVISIWTTRRFPWLPLNKHYSPADTSEYISQSDKWRYYTIFLVAGHLKKIVHSVQHFGTWKNFFSNFILGLFRKKEIQKAPITFTIGLSVCQF